MTDYSKKSWAELRRCMENPADTPDYMKAKEERDHRIKIYGLIVAIGGFLVAVVTFLIRSFC